MCDCFNWHGVNAISSRRGCELHSPDLFYTGDPDGDRIDDNDNATGNNNDIVEAGAGNDLVIGRLGNDIIFGGTGDDTVSGAEGSDTVFGGTGSDELGGDVGDDTIDLGRNLAGDGTDLEADIVVFSDGEGHDTLLNFDVPIDNGDGTFTGIDTLDVSLLTLVM